ncbi:MAG: hypothetical protein IPN60_02965 [Saprospiraceae bacterium]|nr:hypothetical protein [Candidatus Opimibacter skivensis]
MSSPRKATHTASECHFIIGWQGNANFDACRWPGVSPPAGILVVVGGDTNNGFAGIIAAGLVRRSELAELSTPPAVAM